MFARVCQVHTTPSVCIRVRDFAKSIFQALSITHLNLLLFKQSGARLALGMRLFSLKQSIVRVRYIHVGKIAWVDAAKTHHQV